MGIRFRKTIRIAPGVKLNIGKKSASIRVGGKNLGYTTGTAGKTVSASIPGTGLGVTQKLKSTSANQSSGCASVLGGLVVVGLIILMVGFLASHH